MKKIVFIVVLSLVAIFGAIYLDFTSPSRIDDNEIRTYDTGYEDGKSTGYGIGYDEGYEDGCDEGYEIGYSDGESDGYYSGAAYTCLFYGDIDRAFQSAVNGAAWYTFVDAYDQYISNIYDDDDTRLELIWTLVDAAYGLDVTEEEKELLISTFGEDLFNRNNINLSP